MSHNICALVLAEPFDRDVAARFDLTVLLAHGALTLLAIDQYYSAYWAATLAVPGDLELPTDRQPELSGVFPRERVLATMVRHLVGHATPRFGIIITDYFGGVGDQWAVLLEGEALRAHGTINEVLAALGVVREARKDEFDTVGLGTVRRNPEHLAKYRGLCDELGV